jgi:hypothetical protein
MTYNFRNTTSESLKYRHLQQAIARRKEDAAINGRTVINPDVIQNDIDQNAAFVLTEGDTIIGYSALLINEPAYEK